MAKTALKRTKVKAYGVEPQVPQDYWALKQWYRWNSEAPNPKLVLARWRAGEYLETFDPFSTEHGFPDRPGVYLAGAADLGVALAWIQRYVGLVETTGTEEPLVARVIDALNGHEYVEVLQADPGIDEIGPIPFSHMTDSQIVWAEGKIWWADAALTHAGVAARSDLLSVHLRLMRATPRLNDIDDMSSFEIAVFPEVPLGATGDCNYANFPTLAAWVAGGKLHWIFEESYDYPSGDFSTVNVLVGRRYMTFDLDGSAPSAPVDSTSSSIIRGPAFVVPGGTVELLYGTSAALHLAGDADEEPVALWPSGGPFALDSEFPLSAGANGDLVACLLQGPTVDDQPSSARLLVGSLEEPTQSIDIDPNPHEDWAGHPYLGDRPDYMFPVVGS